MENQVPNQQRPAQESPVQLIKIVDDVSECAKVFGVISIIAAAFALVIPVVGTLLITPIAMILAMVALWGGAKKTGGASFAIIVFNLIISPTFWMNIYVGSSQAGATGNVVLSWIDVIGVILMFALLVTKRKKKMMSVSEI